MPTVSLPSHAVSAHWLARHLHLPEVIIFDASLAMPGAEPITEMAVQIGHAQFFDINNISDKSQSLPHMMPSAEQFTEQMQQLGVNEDSIIVVYDDKGIFSSARVWWMFKSMGFEQVAVLDGGLPAWQKAGYETNTPVVEHNEVRSGDFVATHLEGYFCSSNRVMTALADPRTNVLDARSDGRFSGKEKDPRPGVRSGHMPGALNMHYATLFEEEGVNVGLLKSKEELAFMFRRLSPNHRSLIFSCGSGVTACVLVLAATITGYTEILVYDGSWSEWGKLSECPVVYT
jgi:thiosulfate/3-mercaptopyruvate sulfurtransferase